MDAVKFVKEKNRMCDSYQSCEDCPLSEHGCECYDTQFPEEFVDIVETWSEEHPIQTNIDKFKEVFGVSPYLAGYQAHHTKALGMRVDWWKAPYKAPEEA